MENTWEELECHIKTLSNQTDDLDNKMKKLKMQMRNYFTNCEAMDRILENMKTKIDNVPSQLPDGSSTSEASRKGS